MKTIFSGWVQYSGLSKLDINTENFVNYPSITEDPTSLSNDVVVAIERDRKGRLWVGTLSGLNMLDEETGTFKRFLADDEDPDSLPNNTVRSILQDDNGELWIGTYGGLSKWDEDNEQFINYAPIEDNPESIPSIYIMDIKQSPYSKDVLLLGSWGGGVSEFNTKTKIATRYEIPRHESLYDAC